MNFKWCAFFQVSCDNLVKKMKNKTVLRFHFTLARKYNIKKTTAIKWW